MIVSELEFLSIRSVNILIEAALTKREPLFISPSGSKATRRNSGRIINKMVKQFGCEAEWSVRKQGWFIYKNPA